MNEIKATSFGNGFSDALSGRLPNRNIQLPDAQHSYLLGYNAGKLRKADFFKTIAEEEEKRSQKTQ
jgi:hypothetical protein